MKKLFFCIICFTFYSLTVSGHEGGHGSSASEILEKVYSDDQDLRGVIVEKSKHLLPDNPELKSLWKKQIANDKRNQNKVSVILDRDGWPSNYGKSFNTNSEIIFLVIQHSDLEYQLKYFEMVRSAVERGDLLPSSFALLQDRVLIRQGKEQIYGSQLKTDPETGINYFLPIADEENVNQRRKEVGLEPIEEYAKHFGITYTHK